nr:permease [Kutzneria sp. 744]
MLAKLLVVGSCVMSLANSVTVPFLAIYLRTSLGLGVDVVGLVLGSSAIVTIAGGFLGGVLSDHLGRSRMLIACLVGVVVAFLGFYFAGGVVGVLLANSLLALCTGGFSPVGKAMLSDLLPQDTRVTWFSYQYVAINLGYVVGPPLGAVFGVSGDRGSFAIAAVCYAAYVVPLLGFVIRRNRSDRPQPRPAPAELTGADRLRELGRGLKALSTDRRLLLFLIASFLMQSVHNRISVLLAQSFTADVVDATAVLAAVLATNAITVVCVQLLAAKFVARYEAIQALTIGGVLTFVGMAGFAFSTAAWQFVVAMLVFSVGETFVAPSEFAVVDRIAPENLRGAYFGAQTFAGIGGFVGPVLGSLLLAWSGGQAMFLGVGALALVSVVVYRYGRGMLATAPAAVGAEEPPHAP